MEICQQAVQDAELVRRSNEQVGRPAPGLQRSLSRGRFEGPGRRRPDGDPLRPALARPLEAFERIGTDVTPLRVHAMFVETVNRDRAKGANTDMQSDKRLSNSILPASRQQLRRKVQPRRGRSD